MKRSLLWSVLAIGLFAAYGSGGINPIAAKLAQEKNAALSHVMVAPKSAPKMTPNSPVVTLQTALELVTPVQFEAKLPAALQTLVSELLERGTLSEPQCRAFCQNLQRAIVDNRTLLREHRVITTLGEDGVLVEFPALGSSLHDWQSQFEATVAAFLPGPRATAFIKAMEAAGETEPSVDFGRHPRTLLVHTNDEGADGYKVQDTIANSQVPVTGQTYYLGIDEDGQPVWPEELQFLLATPLP